jgi:subtilisin family serine protease
MTRHLLTGLGIAVALVAIGGGARVARHEPVPFDARADTEVVVSLDAPPLAQAGTHGEGRIDAEQRAFRRELASKLPSAHVHWRYRLVVNGYSVVLPKAEVSELGALPGVRDVYASASYAPQALAGPVDEIGAPGVWGPGLSTAGQGVKIGIIDSGVDQSHPYFNPAGYTMPPGFPKGQVKFTTAKVIVARAFPPPGATSRYAKAAFDPTSSSHGTHVAGIAAGDANTRAIGRAVVSGVAPRAYIGNYKALTATPYGASPNGNSAELVAAIEAAVRDGMNVINMSIGEAEIEPSRDIVAKALDAAAAAGVVSVVAAGNDYNDVGAGSVGSPGNSARAITVGAVEDGESGGLVHADFSSVGPSSMSLRMKPDVAAPGVDVLSSVPGGWTSISGTSMASPHVAGAVALLLSRHPSWTVDDVKAALVETGRDAFAAEGSKALAGPSFVGGGVIWLPAADDPLVFAQPANVSFGLLERGGDFPGTIALHDAGGGGGSWSVSLGDLRVPAGTTVVVPSTVTVPGALTYHVVTSSTAAEGDVSGYIVLTRGGDVRRVPFWGRVTAPKLQLDRMILLTRAGIYTGTTNGKRARVSTYRYPANPQAIGVTRVLAGPEAVFRIRIARRVANVGVVVTSEGHGVAVQPRFVIGQNENRLTGWPGLPVDGNPYLDSEGTRVPAAGALLPRVGDYSAVFDSPTRAGAGRFTFRFWVNDVTPPTVRLRTRSVRSGRPILVGATDAGSGVYPASIVATLDGKLVGRSYRRGVVRIPTGALGTGRHRLVLQVSDYQESRNDENVAAILPNTRTLRATVTVRG